MYPARNHYRKGRSNYKTANTEWPRYRCEKRRLCDSNEGEDNTLHLENMLVLDQTEEDMSNDNAASPASCDSSEYAAAASPSDFQTDDISKSHMVILDETNEDNDRPASPAADLSASESSLLSPATINLADEPLRKKTRTNLSEDDERSVVPSSSSSNSAPEAEGDDGKPEKSTRKKHKKSGKTRWHEKSKKTFQMEPVKNNEDVFKFLKQFGVRNESDEAFSIKIKEVFLGALRKYNEAKLEEIFCTEAENSSDEMESSNDPKEQTNSLLSQSTKSECVRIHSATGSPAQASPLQCVSNPTSSADCQPGSPVINPSCNPDASSIASRSPTHFFKELDTSISNQPTNSTYYNPSSPTGSDVLMESESCVTAEADCSDDDV